MFDYSKPFWPLATGTTLDRPSLNIPNISALVGSQLIFQAVMNPPVSIPAPQLVFSIPEMAVITD